MERLLPVSKAAADLRVSPARVRAMIRSGVVEARKIGDRWFLDRASLQRRLEGRVPSGRAFAPRNAWAILFSASAGPVQAAPSLFYSLSPWTRSRLRSQARRNSLRQLAPRLHKRARREAVRVHSGDLPGLLAERGLVRGGLSVASDYDVDIVDPAVAELYVAADRLAELRRKYILEPSTRPNVILHVVEGLWPFRETAKVVPVAVAALDLLESEDPRTRRAGEALLERIEAQK